MSQNHISINDLTPEAVLTAPVQVEADNTASAYQALTIDLGGGLEATISHHSLDETNPLSFDLETTDLAPADLLTLSEHMPKIAEVMTGLEHHFASCQRREHPFKVCALNDSTHTALTRDEAYLEATVLAHGHIGVTLSVPSLANPGRVHSTTFIVRAGVLADLARTFMDMAVDAASARSVRPQTIKATRGY